MAMTFSVKWEARTSLRGGRKGDFFEVEKRGVSMKQSSRKVRGTESGSVCKLFLTTLRRKKYIFH